MSDEYKNLIKKYAIPKLETIETDFGFIDFSCESPLLVEIRRKMVEKIDYFANLILEIIQPDTNITSIYETRFIIEKKRKEWFSVFKILMAFSRRSSALSTFYDETEEVLFVKTFFEEWQTIKVFIKIELNFLSDKWMTENGFEEHFENYMG